MAVANHLQHLRENGVEVKQISETLVEIDGELIDLSKPDAGQRLVEKLAEMKQQKVRLYLEEYVDVNTQLEGAIGKFVDGVWRLDRRYLALFNPIHFYLQKQFLEISE